MIKTNQHAMIGVSRLLVLTLSQAKIKQENAAY
jgi:hypothetical protein